MITETQEFDNLIRKYWKEHIRDQTPGLPLLPEAKVITGIAASDAFLHHLETEHGVEVHLNQYHQIAGFKVVDEKKFTWFLLRWA